MIKSLEISLERYPRNIISLLVIGVGAFVFPIALVFGLILLLFIQMLALRPSGIFFFGMALLTVMHFIAGIKFSEIYGENHQILINLIYQHSLSGLSFYALLVSLPLGIIFSALLAWVLNGKRGLQQNLKHLAKGRKLSKKCLLSPRRLSKALIKIQNTRIPDGSILGVDCYSGEPILLKDSDANSHTLMVGTTGCGKTTGICNILESGIQRRLPVIYVDGKGDLELAHRLQKYTQSQNVPFYLFSMVGESVKYNPLSSGGITSKKDRIVELRHWSEDHYRKIAEGYLQTIFELLQKTNQSTDLVTLSRYLDPEPWYEILREGKNANLIPKVEKLEAQRKNISSLAAEIENMVNSEIGHLFDTTSGEILTLEKALEERAVVYFCLQPLQFPAYAESLGKLIINDIKALAAAQLQKSEKPKIYTIFDEFSVFVGDQIITLINQGRGAGIHAILSTQSLSDIEKKGGQALVGQILNNCNNFCIYRQNNHADAEMLAKVIGTQDAHQITSQLDSKIGSTGAGTVRSTKEFIVHPDEIKRLEFSRAIVLNKRVFSVQSLLQRFKKWC